MEYRPRNPRKNRRRPPRWQRWLVLPAAALVIFGAARLIGYGADWLSARNTARELREVYYDAATETPTAAPTPTPIPAPTAVAAATPLPAQTPGTSLSSLAYPNNNLYNKKAPKGAESEQQTRRRLLHPPERG